ncbi:patatin family protein [Lachnospiraceae bacterium C1.1]|nr:patatin family protein [Lachnospiraceae bacterium C1.1]
MTTTDFKNWNDYSKSAMVLEGGGSRGVFTAGVLDYFMEKNLFLPYVVGVSAGSCNAVDYASAQIGRTRETFIIPDRSKRLFSYSNIAKIGCFYDMKKAFETFPKEWFPFDFTEYQKRGMKTECVVTNIENGKAEYLSEYFDFERLMKICRASSTLPFAADPVKLDGRIYMDGGLADSIPYGRAIMLGYKKVVVIATREAGYRKDPENKFAALIKKKFAEYPKLVRAILSRPAVYNRQMSIMERLENEGRLFVIRPSEKVVGRTEQNVHKLEAFYEHGYNTAVDIYDDLITWLEK